MKILLIGDLHYALKQFDWLLSEAQHYDLVVFAGDLLDVGALATLDAQVVVVLTYMEKLAATTQVVVCSGNHDLDRMVDGERVPAWFDLLDQFEICRDGQHRIFGETLISALPWWDGANTKAALVAQLEHDAALRPKGGHWIWAHHAPPAGSGLSWSGQRSFGDTDLVGLIERFGPDLVLSGHVHEAPFVTQGRWADYISGAWCFNMGRQIGPVPCHIALSLSHGEAIWLSQAGPERLSVAGENRPEPLSKLPAWF